jgi:hypothetical protein
MWREFWQATAVDGEVDLNLNRVVFDMDMSNGREVLL